MDRREFLKRAGVLCTVAVLALHASPGDAADPAPVIVLVTYHSATGNTEKMAQGVAEGAKTVFGTSPEISAKRLRVHASSIVATPWRFVSTHRNVFPSQKDFG